MSATAEGDRFTVEVGHVPGATVLTLVGELDHDTAQPLREALGAVQAEDGERLLVDFSGVAFCDSTGLNVLLQGRQEAERAGTTIEVVGLRRPVERMFRITGVDEIFTVHADVTAALAGRPQHH
ncbi:STAS domain-containing protein [Streptomyces sp. NPDC058746]|uniref:STAS domain-containing protein n=1 Tax=Streptomyces sp. NPDC058746 TaxID=3346622 RepID=UPI0036B767AF